MITMLYRLCINKQRRYNHEKGDRGGARMNDALGTFAANEYREILLYGASHCARKCFGESAYRYLNFLCT